MPRETWTGLDAINVTVRSQNSNETAGGIILKMPRLYFFAVRPRVSKRVQTQFALANDLINSFVSWRFFCRVSLRTSRSE